ncbi:MAG: glycine cleavage system protein GcvH, partial [Rhizomicrobium sp.]
IRVDNGIGVVGITQFAAQQLGDIVFVELPTLGKPVSGAEEVAVVESVKAASEIYAPVSGVVCEVNSALNDEPGLINVEPEGQGWLFKLELAVEPDFSRLMSAEEYATLIASQGG